MKNDGIIGTNMGSLLNLIKNILYIDNGFFDFHVYFDQK